MKLYDKLTKENVFGNMMLSHWPCPTSKFFMTWFHKILRLIFQKQPTLWKLYSTLKKPPIFTAFLEILLYLKNNDSVEHVQKVLVIVLLIYFQVKASSWSSCFSSLLVVKLDLAPPFYFLKWNRCFSVCKNLPNSLRHFWNYKSISPQILHHSSFLWRITPL